MDKKYPLVSIITVNYNGKHFLADCFDSFLALNYPNDKLEIILVDNCSTDGSVDFVQERYPQVTLLQNDVNNYARANNLGIKTAKGEFIALTNNDVRVDKDWLSALIRTAQSDESVGAVGSKILFMDGSIQSVGHQEYPNFYWGDIGFRDKDNGQYNVIKQVCSICGCAVLYRKQCLKDVGFLDEDFNLFLEDVDMSVRCTKTGWKLLNCPQSVIYHKFHGTVGNEDNARHWQEINRLLLITKHWPEKLAEALSGRDYFTVKNGYNSDRDISSVLGKVFGKLIKEHGLEFTNKLSGDLFNAVRRIYNFEKDYLMQVTKDQNLLIALKDQAIAAKNQELASRERDLISWQRQIIELKQDTELLRQQKDQAIAAKNQELASRERDLISWQRQIIELKQDTELLRQQKDQAIAAKNQELASRERDLISWQRQIIELKQDTELLRQQKDLELNSNKLLLQEIRKELDGIYASTGYKYLLRPLWGFLWPIKSICKKLRTFLSKKINIILDVKGKVKSNLLFMKFHHSNNLLSVFLRNIYKKQNVWRVAYYNHIKKGTFAPQPDTAILMITKRCNLTCQFCDLKNGFEEMKTENAFQIIDNLNKIGIKGVVLTGGEPFLHKGLFDIIAYAKKKEIKISVTTNGSLLRGYIQQIINSKIDAINISLDGFEATHDSLRRKKGLYEVVKNNIIELKDKQQNISINYVVTRDNLNELEAFYNWAQGQVIPMDFWPVNHSKALFINPDNEYDTFLRFVKKLTNNNQIPRHRYIYYLSAKKYLNSKNMLRVRCLGLAQSLGIYVNGDIRICCVWGQTHPYIGNAIKDDLEILWHSKEYQELRRGIYNKGCCNGCYNSALSEFLRITGNDFILDK
ncbi:MAG: glycosyltransferase [Candidatus Omnitrophica bacterium]|nr:glycosyltransferase [Candidatus Omnitrophota bacterium]